MKSNRSDPRFVLLSVVLLMALAGALPFVEVTAQGAGPSRASSREACPDSTTGLSISGTHHFMGTCSISGGDITVVAGADATFETVTLTHTGAFDIYNYGTLRILNSTIIGGTSWHGIYSQASATLLKIENSSVKGWTAQGARATTGNRVEIGNSSFEAGPTGNYGIYMSALTGGYIAKNTVKNSSTYGMYLSGSANLDVNNNTVTQTGGTYAAYLTSYQGRFDNNNITGGNTNTIRVINEVPKSFWGNKARGTTANARLYVSGITLNAYFCDFRHNPGVDVQLASAAKLMAYDTYFDTTTFAVSTGVEVYWRANVTVRWLSDGSAEKGAKVNITNVTGAKDPRDLTTDDKGQVRDIYLLEYKDGPAGKKVASPYRFNASATIYTPAQRTFINHTYANITNGTNDLALWLDDVDPPLKIIEPVEGLFTNKTSVALKGRTEANISKEWPLRVEVQVGTTIYRPPVGMDGSFTQDVLLPDEGKHLIGITAFDEMSNLRTAHVNVTRDTIVPILNVTAPTDGALTNQPMISVSGWTELGVNLTINNVTVPLGAGVVFNYQYKLNEGDNTITVKAEDKAHNKAIEILKVRLDTKTPPLNVVEPANGLKTNQPNVRVSGTTEEKANVAINGAAVPLIGPSFTMTIRLNEGPNTIKITSCDAAKNCNTSFIHVILDSIPPPLEVETPRDGLLTNINKVMVSGNTEAEINITVNDEPANLTGSFFSYELALREGKNTVVVVARDDAGNVVTKTIYVYLDTVPPALTLDDPKDGDKFNVTDIEVKGTSEASAQVAINGLKVVNTNGDYATRTTLKEGENSITASAMDLAGNAVNITIKIYLDTKVKLEVDGPSSGSTVETTNSSYVVSGRTDPDAVVLVNDLPVTVKKDGTFRTEVALNIGDNTMTVKAVDPLGNQASSSFKVVRKEPQKPPPIIPPDHGNSGMLVPLLVFAAVLAAVGIGTGLYVRGRKEDKPEEVKPTPPKRIDAPAPPPETPRMAPPPPPPPPPPPAPLAPPQPSMEEPPPGITPEALGWYEEAQRAVEKAEADGEVVTKQRTQLRVAKTYLDKGNNEKVIIYSKKILGNG